MRLNVKMWFGEFFLQIDEQGEEAIDAQAVKEAVVQAIKSWSESSEQD